MTTRRVLAAVAVVLVSAGLALVVGHASRSHAVAVDPHGLALPAERHVRVSRSMPSPSNSDGLHAKLVSGTMPTAAVEATVLTDEECQPDNRGLSHCLNRVRLQNGSEILLRHPHHMKMVPCLAPGEHVRLVPPLVS
jgi:hypothetical protein